MRLNSTLCLNRLNSARFGVLASVDPDRGTHLVPVVFAVAGDELVVPIDSVKPKGAKRLRRLDNLRADGRASLLVDHRDDDWTQLWWVRADLEFDGTADVAGQWGARLADKYPQYRPADTIDSILLFGIRSVRGWTVE